jgi:hypothetical protein
VSDSFYRTASDSYTAIGQRVAAQAEFEPEAICRIFGFQVVAAPYVALVGDLQLEPLSETPSLQPGDGHHGNNGQYEYNNNGDYVAQF